MKKNNSKTNPYDLSQVGKIGNRNIRVEKTRTISKDPYSTGGSSNIRRNYDKTN